MSSDSPLELTISLEPSEIEDERDFTRGAHEFVDALRQVDGLNVQVPEQTDPGARGVIETFTAIAVWGAKVGAFKAIYTLAKDLLAQFQNAEVVLKFKDGSTLKLKGLTNAEAERRIEEHLKRTQS